MTRLLGVLVILLVPLASLAQTPSPPTDWIDEFPSVTEVAHAAFEELKVTAAGSGVDPTVDDTIAVNLAGTFVMLRQLLFLKLQAEPSMAKERAEKLRKVFAAYAEAELTIGQGAAGRRGYITRGPPTGQGCRVQDQECYRRWFLSHLNANTSRAEYRQRVLNRLFPCGDRAKELNAFRQSFGLRTPYVPSPAATLRIEPQIAGLAPAGCVAYGGDSRRNGLCDGWTPPPPPPSAGGSGAFRTSSAACQLVLTKVRMAKNGGLLVSIDPTSAKAGDVVTFRVSRSKAEAPDGSPAIWEQQATIAKGSTDLEAVVATGAQLATDPARPFLVVDATSTRSRGPAHCEQPTTKWEQRHVPPPAFRGLHGPYDSVEDAMRRDGATAIAWWLMNAGRSDLIPDFVWALIGSRREFGYVIVQDNRRPDGKFYTTPPVPSSHVPKDSSEQPTFLSRDYGTSFASAFEGSCENETDYKIAALVHTHPDEIDFYPINDFSMDDYNVLFQFRAKGMPIPKMVMLNGRDRYIRIFTTRPTDRPFWDRELERKRFPDWNDLWNKYTERVMILCVGAALALPSCRR